MPQIKSTISILASGGWITVSEFLRNEIVFKNLWAEHYQHIGLTFVTTPLNGVLWVVWSFVTASALFVLLGKFPLVQSIILVWVTGFILMWLTLFNLQVLPASLLLFAIPWSFVEVMVASYIIQKISGGRTHLFE